MEIQELPEKELKTIVLMVLRKMQDNTDKTFYDISEMIKEQNEKFKKRKKHFLKKEF